MANDNEIRSDLQLISYNMHSFTQGYSVLEDLVTNCRLDVIITGTLAYTGQFV